MKIVYKNYNEREYYDDGKDIESFSTLPKDEKSIAIWLDPKWDLDTFMSTSYGDGLMGEADIEDLVAYVAMHNEPQNIPHECIWAVGGMYVGGYYDEFYFAFSTEEAANEFLEAYKGKTSYDFTKVKKFNLSKS